MNSFNDNLGEAIFDVQLKLMRCFPNSFVNDMGEFIAHKDSNAYFTLRDCKSEEEVIGKVLEWLSRHAYKSQPYAQSWRNKKLHNFMLNGINEFLNTSFNEEEIELIYTKLGNCCNHNLTMCFIKNDYNIDILKQNL